MSPRPCDCHTLSYTERDRIGWLRAAVLGANDGIVSTASLVVGVAAANTGSNNILVAGVAGLVAGAMSMAAGEYVSVSSQADTEKADIERERAELCCRPRSRACGAGCDLRKAWAGSNARKPSGRPIDETRCVGGSRARRARNFRHTQRSTSASCIRIGWYVCDRSCDATANRSPDATTCADSGGRRHLHSLSRIARWVWSVCRWRSMVEGRRASYFLGRT